MRMKKLAIYISTKSIKKDLSLTNVQKSNPGMGATQYLFINLAYMLINNGYLVNFYVDTDIKLKNINVIKVRDIFEAIDLFDKSGYDYLIIRGTDNKEVNEYILYKDIKVIFWTHNRIYKSLADTISKNNNIIKNICVSQHQALSLINHPCRDKNDVIINPDLNSNKIDYLDCRKENSVVFMGTFDKNRGLHVLIRAWEIVTKKIPDAKLYVIGGDLYNANNTETKYVNSIKKRVNKFPSSVYFLGILGQEKYDIFKKCKIAVLNPYGYEAMPVSGIEFMSVGLPIITLKKYGQKEIVINEFNGLFIKGYKDLAKKIIYLLECDEIREQYSINAIKYLKNKFNYKNYEKNWIDVINNNSKKYNMSSMFDLKSYSFSEKYELAIFNIKNKIRIIPSYFELINLIRKYYILRFKKTLCVLTYQNIINYNSY